MKISKYVFLALFITVVSLIFIAFYIKKTKQNLNPPKYKKCKPVFGTLESMFIKNKIEKVEDENWDLYIPCGYNNVENELLQMDKPPSGKKIYGIKGCDSIVSKNNLWDLLLKYYGRNFAKTIMPDTYVIVTDNDLAEFKNNFKPTNTYILKKNIQRKQGLKMTNKLDEIISASKDNFKVAQLYMKNTYLINKRKLNLRIYLLIVCKDNKMTAYVNKEGKCLYTNKDYNDSELDFESNITSFNTDIQVYDNNPLTLEDFKQYLSKNKINPRPIFEKIDHKIFLLMEAVDKPLCKLEKLKKNVNFQLFGLDFIIEKDTFEPYLLEINKGPDMQAVIQDDKDMKIKVQEDAFKLADLLPSDGSNSFYKIWSKYT